MLALVTKASIFGWYEIRSFDTMEDILRFIEKCGYGIIIEKNSYTVDKFSYFYGKVETKDIPTITQCPLHITIYDDYVE